MDDNKTIGELCQDIRKIILEIQIDLRFEREREQRMEQIEATGLRPEQMNRGGDNAEQRRNRVDDAEGSQIKTFLDISEDIGDRNDKGKKFRSKRGKKNGRSCKRGRNRKVREQLLMIIVYLKRRGKGREGGWDEIYKVRYKAREGFNFSARSNKENG